MKTLPKPGSNEDETWPWTRSKKGVLPKEQRKVRVEKKASAGKKVPKTVKNAAEIESSSKPPSPCKIVTPAKPVVKKYIKKLSERKFQELRHLVKMNLTMIRKDYELLL